MTLLFTGAQDDLRLLMERLLNLLMLAERQAYLQAEPYQRTPARRDQANGFKPKTLKTRLGLLALRVPQIRKGAFYPSVRTKGRRSERAAWLILAEMDCPWGVHPQSRGFGRRGTGFRSFLDHGEPGGPRPGRNSAGLAGTALG